MKSHSNDLSKVVSEPFLLFKASDNKFVTSFRERGMANCMVTDGPFVLKESSKMKIFWSSFVNGKYVVLEAIADNIHSKWKHFPPRFDFEGGHAMIFEDFEGKKFFSLHSPNIPEKERIDSDTLVITAGQEISHDEITKKLAVLGFERVDFVSNPGQYAVRGSIIDIFSYSENYPYRVLFWGDEIEKIHFWLLHLLHDGIFLCQTVETTQSQLADFIIKRLEGVAFFSKPCIGFI